MIKFGPSGFSQDFEKEFKSTVDMPKWLLKHNLNCYEMAFTYGVNLADETAKKYGDLFKESEIEVSVHAPYYINFANPNEEAFAKSVMYIVGSLKKMKLLNAKKLVFHPGTMMKMTREEAFNNIYENIKRLMEILDSYDDLGEFYLCPETMGKHGQIGTVEEIAKICSIDKRIIPTLDFGHINAFNGGSLKTEKDYENVFKILKSYLGDRFNKVHIHFSKIEYGKKGEIKHLTFDDEVFGPNFEPLAKVLKKLNIDASVISESNGEQTRDAEIMRNIYNVISKNNWFFGWFMIIWVCNKYYNFGGFMITAGELRKGVTFEYEGKVYVVVDFLHVKPGKGAAFVRTKLKNVITGQVIEMTFNPVTKFEKAQIERKQMQYLYSDGDLYYFMDNETYEQIPLNHDQVEDALQYIVENMDVTIQFYKGEAFSVEPPNFVELKIVECEPGVQGDTSKAGNKPAKLETGLVLQVPLFVNNGDTIRIDTRTGTYMSRV